MQDQILKLISDRYSKTNGGCTLPFIGESLKITQEELKSHLNALYKDGKISIRQGINQKLIYLK